MTPRSVKAETPSFEVFIPGYRLIAPVVAGGHVIFRGWSWRLDDPEGSVAPIKGAEPECPASAAIEEWRRG